MFSRCSAADLVYLAGARTSVLTFGDLEDSISIPSSATLQSVATMQSNRRMVQVQLMLNSPGEDPQLICITVPGDLTVSIEDPDRFPVDVHGYHPTDCHACSIHPINRACLSHTCPDCGSITWGERNDLGELTHFCPSS